MVEDQKSRTDRTTKVGIALIAILLLTLPALALIVSFQDEDEKGDVDYEPTLGSLTGDMSMDEGSRDAWEEYLGNAPTVDLSFTAISGEVSSEDPAITYQVPDINGTGVEFREGSQNGDDDSKNGAGEWTDGDDRAEEPAMDAEGEYGDDREVEESDIVKVIGDRMYVLNHYRGLVVVNIENTASPYMEGYVQTLGYPISMYVVDFLGFVIVSNAPTLDGEGEYSGILYIIDLLDNSNPRIVKMVELPGYPVDSRRVGEVIYVVSNEYDYHYGPWFGGRGFVDDIAMEEGDMVDGSFDEEESEGDGPKTFITSIGFYDPKSIGQRDRVEIDGNAGMIHASSFAIYVPQPNYDYSDPATNFVYVDISDPKGDIQVRDDIEIPGLLMDRYQMDHYMGMFRVVTQKWPSSDWWSELPMSTLYVIDARDPDYLKRVSSLLIDDSGNLMATRFAGNRAYTIHLPRTIDPLDVIDLSNPSDPKLTDILELPGWVEHMEVIGYNIIAIGVDDTSDDGWKVALSLFDVSDASNAVLKDRIIIGEGHTYSSANYDPKALTILEDQGLVLIPFNSYNWDNYNGPSNGVQMVYFDLDLGTMDELGVIPSNSGIERTRWANNAVITMSQTEVMTVDVSNLLDPRILGRVEIASNVADAFFSDDYLVTLVEPYWGQTGGGIRISSRDAPHTVLASYGPSGLEFTNVERENDIVYIKGIRQGDGKKPVSELHIYDLEDPMNPVMIGPVDIEVPANYYYFEKYYEPDADDILEGENGNSDEEQITEEPVYSRLYHDPLNMKILGDGSVAIYSWIWNYYGSGSFSYVDVNIVSWDGTGRTVVDRVTVPMENYIQDIVGNKDRILIATQNWWPPSTNMIDVDLTVEVSNVTGVHQLTGNFIGASDDLTRIYTKVVFSDNESTHYNINSYGFEGDQTILLQSIDVGSPLSDVRFNGDSIIVISQGWDYWWGYRYYEEDVVYDDSEGEVSVSAKEGTDGSSEPYNEPEGTEIVRIDIDNGAFGDVSRMTLEDNVYASLVTDEFIVLDWSMTHTVVSISSEPAVLGSWFGNGWVTGGDQEGDDLVLSLGMYGIEFRTF